MIILTPSSPDYVLAIQRTSELAIRRPALVALPTTFNDVPKLIQFARSNSLEIAVKGGGANQTTAAVASSEGGLVIDLVKLNRVNVSDDKQSATVQGGALWGDVYESLSGLGLDAVGAAFWIVGVGGSLTSGGWSHMNGSHGMGVDNIIEATVALADGSTVKASPQINPDLFFAIRGGLGLFGIVLEFVLRVYPTLGPMHTGVLITPADRLDRFITALQETLRNIELHDKLVVIFSRDNSSGIPLPQISLVPVIPGSAERAEKVLRPVEQVATFKKITTVPDQYAQSHSLDSLLAQAPKRVYYAGSMLEDFNDADVFDIELFRDVWNRWEKWTAENELGKESVIMWAFSRAGVVKIAPAGETAFNKRDSANFVIVQGRTRTPDFDGEIEAWTRAVSDAVRAKQPNGGVVASLAYGTETVEDIFGKDTAKRLRSIKEKYDPEYVWTKGYCF